MGKKQRQRLVFLRYKRHKILNKKHNIKQPIKPNKMKKVIRKRNKLVQLATKLKGEELKAVEYAIKLIDFMIDNNQ